MCEHDIYALPTVEFVGGSTQELVFHAYYQKGRRQVDLTDCTSTFSVLSYANRNGEPVLSKVMEVSSVSVGETPNTICVTLEPADTVGLGGKYIYQITIEDSTGDADIPKQGVLRIIDNIDKNLIS